MRAGAPPRLLARAAAAGLAAAAPAALLLVAVAAAVPAPRAAPALAAAAPAAAPASAAAPAAEREVPKNDGWVTDLASLLTPAEEQELEARMESYKRGSGNDIALLTVPDLGGEPIENFSLRVARAWKLGSVEKNNGALLVVSKGDHEMRIEVGRGLEGTLPDIICGRIIHDVITPQFQQGDFAAGLRLGVEALQKAAGGDYADLPDSDSGSMPVAVVASVIPFVVFLFILFIILARHRGGGPGGRTRSSIWPWLMVANSLGRSSGGFGGGGGGFGGGFGGGSFGGFGGGGGFSGGGASGKW